jgi:hypothetical protein
LVRGLLKSLEMKSSQGLIQNFTRPCRLYFELVEKDVKAVHGFIKVLSWVVVKRKGEYEPTRYE